eukprot:2396237-Pyramimonas_sp.AAC.1
MLQVRLIPRTEASDRGSSARLAWLAASASHAARWRAARWLRCASAACAAAAISTRASRSIASAAAAWSHTVAASRTCAARKRHDFNAASRISTQTSEYATTPSGCTPRLACFGDSEVQGVPAVS